MADESNIWLYPTPATQEYLKRRQRHGDDPFPHPENEREEIMHEFWLISVAVAGWWLEETSYLRDLLQKYKHEAAVEAERMEKEAAERVRRSLLLPSRAQIRDAVKDAIEWRKAKRAGIRRIYQGSGVESLGGT